MVAFPFLNTYSSLLTKIMGFSYLEEYGLNIAIKIGHQKEKSVFGTPGFVVWMFVSTLPTHFRFFFKLEVLITLPKFTQLLSGRSKNMVEGAYILHNCFPWTAYQLPEYSFPRDQSPATEPWVPLNQ